MIRRRELPGHITQNDTKFPHYYVKVDLIENSVRREEYEKALLKISELETKLKIINDIALSALH